ncbi:alpha-E domain-containing protein [Aestuariivirga sp. YIM B02566]|uniref:Alpha-E domain-containing protein n=1 Tax=Taklimakanibacter albus TaxID=2800327 RepID=A0ACC5R9L7_9HYPH|nr:alpha-E domain-containing protein [Aestuariivirga sp. YIM B02566]MBK1869381.1 alpha-E domain-containing protein [Aestuariivirga sp. YIM B02566]
MLGRTAASLFWLSRYVERAENMARLLEVGYRISLMPRAIEGHRDDWRSTLTSAACEASYFAKHKDITTPEIIHHLLFDDDNPSSVRTCLRTARNNGRAVRTALTRDVWESLNGTWNEYSQITPGSIGPDRLPGFLDWIKQRAMLFRGALLGTMLRHDTYYFSQLGTFIERADNTARILDVKYYILLPKPSDVGSDVDIQQWSTVLRSVSAHRAYRWFYRDSTYRPWLVAEFLILREEMPRSLIFCYQWLTRSLNGLGELYGQRYECQTEATELYARLKAGNMDDIFQSGLHEFLQDFVNANNRIAAQIAQTYNFP